MSEALGLATVTSGIDGQEKPLQMHVVEGQTPLLLSSKWLYEQGAIVDFWTASDPVRSTGRTSSSLSGPRPSTCSSR